MIIVSINIEITSPVRSVFEFLTNTNNYLLWQSDIVSIENLTPGPWRKGTKVRTFHRFFGLRFVDASSITEFTPFKSFSSSGSLGRTLYTENFLFEDFDSYTFFKYRGFFQLGGFLRLFQPLIRPVFRAQMRNNFHKLKNILEASNLVGSTAS